MIFIIIVVVFIVACAIYAHFEKEHISYAYKSGKRPVCPKCGQSNYFITYEKVVITPEKTKGSVSLNLNPLKPFTLIDYKEKVVQKEVSNEVIKLMCNVCGNKFTESEGFR